MKDSLTKYQVHPAADPNVTYTLVTEPVLRFTNNTVGDVKDGTIFLWVGEEGRPAAAVQVFLHRDGHWYQEFSSLSTPSLSAGRVWGPTRGGVTFKPVPEAPKPAATAEQRLRQMRTLADGFSAEQDFHDDGVKAYEKLRFLTKPLARYGKPGTAVEDGALFAYVLTTDPEVYLMLEARPGKDGPEWQYAFAVESMAAVRGTWKGDEVWSLPVRHAWEDRLEPYYIYNFAREPKK